MTLWSAQSEHLKKKVMSPKLRSKFLRARRVIAATCLAVAVAVVTISAQYGVFNEGFEGEIWELIETLPVDEGFSSGVAWVNGELYVLNYYTGVV
jgi:hypothetical protein